MTKIIVRNDQGYKAYHNGGIYWKLCTAPSTPPVPPGPDPTEPFYVKAGNEDIVVSIKGSSMSPYVPIEYSLDRVTWQSLGTTSSSSTLTVNVSAGNKVWLRSSFNAWASTSSRYNYIKGDKSHTVGGNIMSLLYGSNFTGSEVTFPSGSSYNFCSLFTGDNMMMDASELILPATTLTDGCYYGMFYNCTSLTTAPALPATVATNYCYYYMFYNCTSLTTAPALPATTVKLQGYYGMFQGCTSLTTAPALPATTVETSSYREMFKGCTSLVEAPGISAEIPTYWSYASMFQGCTKLNYIRCLATNVSAANCTNNWVSGVASTGTFVKKAGVSWSTGYNGIPSGWTVVEE